MRKISPPLTVMLRVVLFACAVLLCGKPLPGQTNPACTSEGYRVIARQWDAALGINWELWQDCAHPERPARAVAASHATRVTSLHAFEITKSAPAPPLKPLLVHAGDAVRLWQQDNTVRIEISGIAEQSAHEGEPVIVRITRQTEDAGLNVQRISGTVRAANDVEMER